MCFTADVSYLCDILGMGNNSRKHALNPERRFLSPYQEAQADKWIAAGMSHRQIGEDLGVPTWVIDKHASTGRRAIA